MAKEMYSLNGYEIADKWAREEIEKIKDSGVDTDLIYVGDGEMPEGYVIQIIPGDENVMRIRAEDGTISEFSLGCHHEDSDGGYTMTVDGETLVIEAAEDGTLPTVSDETLILPGPPSSVGTAETYEGEYEITPSTEAQTLATSGKLMTEDLQISEIPYVEDSSGSNGTTVTIA